jgi:hypothetical protein
VNADKAGLAAPMLHALLLGHRLLGLPIPETVLARGVTDRRVRRLHRLWAPSFSVTDWYCVPSRKSFAGFLRYSVRLRLYVYFLRLSWPYWKYQVMRELINPGDWQLLRLPDQLIWIYPLLRPFGWLVRRGR